MSQVKQAAAGAAMNLSERIVRLAGETSDWIATNSVDILIASAAAVVVALILLALRSFGQRILSDDKPDGKWPGIFARVLSKTTLFFIVACSVALVAEHAETPPSLMRFIEIAFIVAASVQAAIWARELILGLIEHRVGVAEEHSTLGSAIGIIRLLVTVGLFTIAIILILSNLGVNVTGLVAGLGIGGIAIGLAAQGIFSDLFAALAIIFDRPFRRGDTIRYDTTTGTVEHIGLKTTRLRSIDGQQIVMSNTNLLNKEIHNFALLEHRRFLLVLGVVYQTPLERLRHIPHMIADVVGRHDKVELVRCGMRAFGPSSLDFELQFDVFGADYEYAFATRAAICLEIVEAFNEAGIQFAYPTQTTFTAAPDGTLVMPYATHIHADAGGSKADIVQG
jgi:small-conductance mechanosensitive channel